MSFSLLLVKQYITEEKLELYQKFSEEKYHWRKRNLEENDNSHLRETTSIVKKTMNKEAGSVKFGRALTE